MSAKVSALVRELPKSTIPAGHARAGGQFVFFVSGPSALQCDVGFREGDAVILSTGGNAAVHYARGRYSYSTDCWALEPVEEKIVGEFLYYYLASQVEQIDRLGFEGSGLRHLRKDFIRGYPVPKFSRSEQATIARVLSIADRAIAQTEALIAKQQRIKTGLMRDLLARGIDDHGNIRSEQTHDFKDSPLGRIPDAWAVRSCEQLCRDIVVGIVIRPAQYYRPDGVPVLRSANVRSGWISTDDLVFMSDRDNQLLRKSQLRDGDLVTVRTGYPGTTAVIPPELDGCNCVDIVISRPNREAIRPAYLSLWVNSDHGKRQVLEGQGGLAQQHFNVKEMRRLLVRVPELSEQERIEQVISSHDHALQAIQRQSVKLRSLKAGLMQDLLTGDRGVTALSSQAEMATA